MPLINCSACGNKISVEAEACPQCGHPNRVAEPESMGPQCYSCSAAATTRCQSCGTFSCPRHVQSIYVSHGRGGAYELRCQACYSSAMTWKIVGGVLFVIILFVILAFWFGNFR